MGRRSLMMGPMALLMVGTAVAQRPAAVAPNASNAAPEPAPSLRLPISPCYGMWDVRTPSQTALDQSIDRCTARIAALIQSKRGPETVACAYFARGFAHAGQQDYARAILDYDEAIKLMPRSPHWHKYRGIAYQELRDYARATADYNEAIRQTGNPDLVRYNLADLYHIRADLYYSQGDLAHAVADYSEAIQLDRFNATYYRSRAEAYRAQNDERRATADLDEWKWLMAPSRPRPSALRYHRAC